jgi:hypothetical protein
LNYLLLPALIKNQESIKTKESIQGALNGMVDILEFGGTERTHWRDEISKEAVDFRTQIRIAKYNVRHAGAYPWPLYHMCLFYIGIAPVAKLLSMALKKRTDGEMVKDKMAHVNCDRILGEYFGEDRTQQLLGILNTALSL